MGIREDDNFQITFVQGIAVGNLNHFTIPI